MKRGVVLASVVVLAMTLLAAPSSGRDRPFSTSQMIAIKLLPAPQQFDLPGLAGGQFSKKQIERFRCQTSGDPADAVDISCNDKAFGQRFAPDNELAIAVDPNDSDHLLAGSNDYFYRFNNSTGARQALVPTGFFTSFDGGETWIDGQVPFGNGNGNGDPAPAFDGKHDVALMAQLSNVAGQGGFFVSQGNVSVSRSLDGGIHWQKPVTVFKGKGTGIGPANQAVFWDKEYIAVDNFASSPHYGRIYVTATKFVNGLQGSYTKSPIAIAWSDDGGATFSKPKIISGANADACTYQETGAANECDEDQFSYPAVGSDGRLYVHFLNGQNEAEWEVPFEFDSQVMVVRSDDGGATFTDPVVAAQLEDGLSDMPYSVINRQTIWGHQLRWTAAGTIAVDPTDPDHVAIVFADRGTANPNATAGCFDALPGTAPNYDPCDAGPSSETDVFAVHSHDGGDSWSTRDSTYAVPDRHQWFPWAAFMPTGDLAVAWDEDTAAAPADTFQHVLMKGNTRYVLGDEEHIDVSVTHWTGQYVPQERWPTICGPAGYTDPPVTDAEGKDCNVFHGDYTGLAVGSDGAVHVVWTGLNRFTKSPQLDFYTDAKHDGYAQDAMYAKR
jgi:hypothetical protein